MLKAPKSHKYCVSFGLIYSTTLPQKWSRHAVVICSGLHVLVSCVLLYVTTLLPFVCLKNQNNVILFKYGTILLKQLLIKSKK